MNRLMNPIVAWRKTKFIGLSNKNFNSFYDERYQFSFRLTTRNGLCEIISDKLSIIEKLKLRKRESCDKCLRLSLQSKFLIENYLQFDAKKSFTISIVRNIKNLIDNIEMSIITFMSYSFLSLSISPLTLVCSTKAYLQLE